MTFGEKLRLYRTEQNMTQAELAEKSGVGRNTINNYEHGKTYPKNRQVYSDLPRVLKVDVCELKNEGEDFVFEAKAKYGTRGAAQAESLIRDAHALFAGGELSDADKEGVMLALQEAYWLCKKENSEKFGRKNKEQG